MSHFAGVIFANKSKPVDGLLCKNIRKVLSRYPDEEIDEFSAPGIYLAKFDVGAIGSAGVYRAHNGGFSVVAGDPVLQLDRSGPSLERLDALHRFHEALDQRNSTIFDDARGTYCCAHYYPHRHRLVLVTDSLAARSLYCYSGEGFIFFATSMRVIEEVDFIPKIPDESGLFERIGFGFSLAGRTPYRGVRYLDAAEILDYENGEISRSHYFHWDSLEENSIGVDEAIPAAVGEFAKSLSCRLRPGETSVNAFLSGGLDSRLIVTGLSEQVGRINTFNSARENSADRIIGRRYAEAIGSRHHEYVHIGDFIHPALGILGTFTEPQLAHLSEAQRPRLFWSGEVGSFILGYCHLTDTMISAARGNKLSDAIDEFMSFNQYAMRNPSIRNDLRSTWYNKNHNSTQIEIDNLNFNDKATSLFVFILINYEKMTLTKCMEYIDLSRIEIQSPFLDKELLKLMIRLPVHEGLYHKFYHDLLEHYPSVIREVPWQTYPGHLPCPLPLPAKAQNQWSKSEKWQWPGFRNMLRGLSTIMPPFGRRSPLLNWRKVIFADLMTRFGFIQFSYIPRLANVVQAHHEKCLGSMRHHETT